MGYIIVDYLPGGGGGGSDGSGCGCFMFLLTFILIIMNGTADIKTAFICAFVVAIIVMALAGN